VEDTLSNYDMDEIDRLNEKEKSQKQKEQWRNYVEDSLKHPLDSRYSSNEGFGRDDQNNIKEILRKNNVVQDHIDKELKEMTLDPLGYERKHTPKSTLPLGNRDKIDESTGLIVASKPNLDKIEACALPLVDDNTSREELDMLRRPLEKEEVTNPTHYNERKMEPLDYIIANELDFLEGNIIKYITRYTYKGGVNDLLKARTYLEKLIERERDGR
jgi:hypothetical protein